MGYRHVLAAVDLASGSEPVAARAREVAECFAARLSLLHVVESLPLDLGDGVLPGPAVGLDEEIIARARGRLAEFAGRLGLPEGACILEVGGTRQAVLAAARESGADLIVVGHHERHGLALLLRSTADAVLESARCDVLALHL